MRGIKDILGPHLEYIEGVQRTSDPPSPLPRFLSLYLVLVKIEALDVHKLHGAPGRSPLKGPSGIQGKTNSGGPGASPPEAIRFYGIFNAKSPLKFVQYYENEVRPYCLPNQSFK